MKKAQAEIDTVLGQGRPTFDLLKKLECVFPSFTSVVLPLFAAGWILKIPRYIFLFNVSINNHTCEAMNLHVWIVEREPIKNRRLG